VKALRAFVPSALLVAVPFLAVRVPCLASFPVLAVMGDSATYFHPIGQVEEGYWPTFEMRPPGYPLFLGTILALSHNARAVVVAQNVVSLLAQLWLVSGVYALSPSLAPWAAIATAISRASLGVFDLDVSLMADSLYTSVLLVMTGFMVRVFAPPARARDLVGVSLFMAAAIVTRPAGMFLIVTYLVLLLVLVRAGTATGRLAFLAIPLPLALLALCAYNALTVGQFAISPWGTANVVGATACFAKPSPKYPPGMNWAIETLQSELSPEERATLELSWSLPELSAIYAGHFNAIHEFGMLDDYGERSQRDLLEQVAADAIRARPDLYAKFVSSQFDSFLRSFMGNDWSAYAKLMSTHAYVLMHHRGLRRQLLRRHGILPDVLNPPNVDPSSPREIEVPTPASVRLLAKTYGVFRGALWLWLWFAVLCASVWRLARTLLRDQGAGLVFLVSSLHLGAGLLVSLVEIGEARYSSPTEFAIFLSPALAPLLFSAFSPKSETPRAA
jgi:hypothetical protein